MTTPFKADFVHGSIGSFVTIQPAWSLSPHDSPSSEHIQISSCYYMNSAHARDLAKQLMDAADAADARTSAAHTIDANDDARR
jgi:hypothetical protein